MNPVQALSFENPRRAMNITICSISGELLAFSGVCGGERERSLDSNDKACCWRSYDLCLLYILKILVLALHARVSRFALEAGRGLQPRHIRLMPHD